MKVAVFSAHQFEKDFFQRGNQTYQQALTFFDAALNEQTAGLACGFEVVCCFVTDHLGSATLEKLKAAGVRLITLRCAGYNNVDLQAAQNLALPVVRVPAYSPHAVAEHAVAMLLSLNRKIHRAYARVRELNFSLEGLIGFDLCGKTIGVIGTGRIGRVFAKIMKGFDCEVIAHDLHPDQSLVKNQTLEYVALDELYRRADVISLHVPLVPATKHLLDAAAFSSMKPGAIVINTGRGALIDASALVGALKSAQLGGAALDVYEEEDGIFFNDVSNQVLQDDVLARLLTFPNVLMTSHQAFFTKEAMLNIVDTTLKNISEFESAQSLKNQVHATTHLAA